MPQASSLAAEIKDKTGTEPTLIKGGAGIFDVVVDDQLVFSKHEEKRFPKHDEILQKLTS